MIPIDWIAVALGLSAGTVASAAYFAGLAFSVRMALRSDAPVRVLMASAVIRIAGLIGIGWLVVGQGGPWSLLGYAAAFLILRFVVTAFARVRPAPGAVT